MIVIFVVLFLSNTEFRHCSLLTPLKLGDSNFRLLNLALDTHCAQSNVCFSQLCITVAHGWSERRNLVNTLVGFTIESKAGRERRGSSFLSTERLRGHVKKCCTSLRAGSLIFLRWTKTQEGFSQPISLKLTITKRNFYGILQSFQHRDPQRGVTGGFSS